MKKIIISLIFCFIILGKYNLSYAMKLPNPEKYPNPYTLLDTLNPELTTQNWTVVCNRDHAPILKEPGSSVFERADYLESFKVTDRKGMYLYIISDNRENVKGWMDMKYLILTLRAIQHLDTGVYLKAFLKVRLEKEPSKEGFDSLRFREGPGQGIEKEQSATHESQYTFLTSKEEIPKVGTIFFYVYAIHFDENNPRYKEDVYKDVVNFKNADYFLLGTKPSISTEDIKDYLLGGSKLSISIEDIKEKKLGIIVGWISNKSCVLWDTRQALEKVANRPKSDWDAHVFKDRKTLKRYFDCNSNDEKQLFLNSEELVPDKGENPPDDGQQLRYIVIGREDKYKRIVSEEIGYTGRASASQQISDEQQKFLADLHAGSKFLEVFFLIDATISMEPCLNAASYVAKGIIKKISEQKDLDIALYGAVYRDTTEGSERYEESPENITPDSLSKWFENISAYSKRYDDYPEDLFNAINDSVEKWKRNFRHPYSSRVMIILGDAGDRSSETSGIISQLTENMIIPVAIHFQQTPNNQKEKDAMNKFISQMGEITHEINNMPVRSVSESQLQKELDVAARNISIFINHFVKNMPDIRLGSKKCLDIFCERAFNSRPELIPGCKECNNKEEFDRYIIKNSPKTDNSDYSYGLAVAQLKYLEKRNSRLWEYITKYPEMGFSNGFIALRKQDTQLTRPVLLLADYELNHLLGKIENLTRNYRTCSIPERNKEESTVYKLIVTGMSTILGELFDNNPSTLQQMFSQFGVIIDKEKSFLPLLPEKMEELCNDTTKWRKFLAQLEVAKDSIDTIRREKPKSKTYINIEGNPYFWIYPEELFPPLPR